MKKRIFFAKFSWDRLVERSINVWKDLADFFNLQSLFKELYLFFFHGNILNLSNTNVRVDNRNIMTGRIFLLSWRVGDMAVTCPI